MKLVHFQRRPSTTFHFSVERLFHSVRTNLPAQVDCRLVISRFSSNGVWRRLYNMVQAALLEGDVNHITGDIHYVGYLLSRRRTILTILDCAPMSSLAGWRRRLFQLFWLRLPARRAALITTISEFSKAEILRYVRCRPDKIRVIGVPAGAEFGADLKDFNEERPRILQVGTQPNKNLERVAEALRSLPCSLRVIGELSDSQREILNSCGIDYSNTSSLTNTQLLEEFRQCDVLVFASTYEGFGMPIVEANAVGRAVVAGNVCSMPEVASDAACLVDPFQVDSIRRGIQRVIQDRTYREALIRNGLDNARRFTPKAIASQYLQIYLEVYDESHHASQNCATGGLYPAAGDKDTAIDRPGFR